MPETILIIGATGNQGGAVINHLTNIASNATIRALVRDIASETALQLQKKGIELVKGSLENADSMKEALKGVTRIFFHTTHNSFKGESWETESQKGLAALEHIKNCLTLQQIVYSTLPEIPGYQEALGKITIEDKIRELNLPLTTVLAPFYLENFINIWPPIRKYFGLFGAFQWGWLPTEKELRMPHGSVQDFGAVVAEILCAPVSDFLNKKVAIVAEDIALSNLLKEMGKGLNQPIYWVPMNPTVFRNLPFPKEALHALEFYAQNLSDFQKVENGFIQTKGIGPQSLTEAVQESKTIYPNIQSIENWSAKNKKILTKRSLKIVLISLVVSWAKVKAMFR